MHISFRNTVTVLAGLLALLSMLGHTAAAMAPVWQDRQSGFELVICTAWGTRTVVLDVGVPAERENKTPEHTDSHTCPFCLALAPAHLTSPLSSWLPVFMSVHSFTPARFVGPVLSPAFATIVLPRAPPVLS